MGWLKKLWDWILGTEEEILIEKAKGLIKFGDKILEGKVKTYKNEGLIAWIRNSPFGKQIIFKIICSKCKKTSNTSNYNTAKRKKYLCQSCSDIRTGRKK